MIFDAFVVFAATHDNEGETLPPIIELIIGIATMLLILGVGILFVYKGFKLWNSSETRAYKILKTKPHLINGLIVFFIQKEGATRKVDLQILSELSIKDEKLVKLNFSEEQLSLLKQYVSSIEFTIKQIAAII